MNKQEKQRVAYGKTVSSARKHMGLTQREFGKKIRRCQPFVCEIEKGRTGVSKKTQAAIAKALMMTLVK